MKSTSLNLLLCGAFALFFQPTLLPQEKYEINFVRKNAAGDRYKARIDATNTVECLITGKSGEKRTVKNTSVSLSATMKIIEADKEGTAKSIVVDTDLLSGKIDDRETNIRKGAKYHISFRDGTAMITRMKGKLFETPSDDEKTLLTLVFRPPSGNSLADLIGTKNEVAVGDNWNPDNAVVKNLFASRNIVVGDKNISNEARLDSLREKDSISCWRLLQKISLSDIPGMEFSFDAEILLPRDNKTVPLFVRRTASEKITRENKNMAKGSPLADDMESMEIGITDKFEASLTPLAAEGG